jgi:hypothetical protein
VGGIHEATWHMWRCCRDLLVWIDHSDVVLVPEECTHPPSRTLAEYVHEAKMCTHALIPSHAQAGTRWNAFLYEDPPHVII